MIACVISVWQFVMHSATGGHDSLITLSQLQDYADKGRVADVTVNGTDVTGHFKDSKESFHTTIPSNYPDLYKSLHDKGVNITIKE